MQATSTTSETKNYLINDEGDAYELVLLEEGNQVGGGLFPFLVDEDRAFALAQRMGEAFCGR